jgi:hypothetical protein
VAVLTQQTPQEDHSGKRHDPNFVHISRACSRLCLLAQNQVPFYQTMKLQAKKCHWVNKCLFNLDNNLI